MQDLLTKAQTTVQVNSPKCDVERKTLSLKTWQTPHAVFAPQIMTSAFLLLTIRRQRYRALSCSLVPALSLSRATGNIHGINSKLQKENSAIFSYLPSRECKENGALVTLIGSDIYISSCFSLSKFSVYLISDIR